MFSRRVAPSNDSHIGQLLLNRENLSFSFLSFLLFSSLPSFPPLPFLFFIYPTVERVEWMFHCPLICTLWSREIASRSINGRRSFHQFYSIRRERERHARRLRMIEMAEEEGGKMRYRLTRKRSDVYKIQGDEYFRGSITRVKYFFKRYLHRSRDTLFVKIWNLHFPLRTLHFSFIFNNTYMYVIR